jgi:predicted ribosomally synthesized peptide with SipW-like signal peptide
MEGRTMSEGTRGGFGRRLHRKVLGSMVVLGLVGVVAGVGTWSAFSATTSNPNNQFTAGTVAIGDDDSGGAIFTMAAMKPGSTDTGCIEVTYTGSLASNVTMYGTTTGTGLDPYIDVVITRGTIASPSFDSCTGFSADAGNYIGAGAGIVYSGTLAAYPDNFGAGLLDAPSATESWSTNEKHVYKIQVTLQDTNAAKGLDATQVFTWEARNT